MQVFWARGKHSTSISRNIREKFGLLYFSLNTNDSRNPNMVAESSCFVVNIHVKSCLKTENGT